MSRATVRLAAAAYPVETLPDWAALTAKLTDWVAEAAGQGAEIAVFPEYAAVEAALIGAPEVSDWLSASADVAPQYRQVMADLARRFGVVILSGSGPWRDGGRLVNRAWLCSPEGAQLPLDKMVLTPWERANTGLAPGRDPWAARTRWGRLAGCICYDSEVPDLARALLPDILLIPACTDALSGQSRVQIAARARALELQCVTVHAPLVGDVPGCDLIDTNVGAAGIFVPPDRGLPQDGVLALGDLNAPGWVVAEAPLALLAQRRQDGEAQLRVDAAAARWPKPRLRTH